MSHERQHIKTAPLFLDVFEPHTAGEIRIIVLNERGMYRISVLRGPEIMLEARIRKEDFDKTDLGLSFTHQQKKRIP